MSPLHPPRGLSATAGALCSPRMSQCHQPPKPPSPWLPGLAAAPGAGSALVSAALSLRKTPPRAGGLGTRAAARLRHSRPSFAPAPSKAPSQPLPPHPLRCAGVRGVLEGPEPLTCPVPGWETSCPALSSALRDAASASAPGWGAALPRSPALH